MKTFIVCLLACLPVLLLARPNQFDAKAAFAKYALAHPNTDQDEPECEILGNSEDDEVNPLNAIVDRRKRWKNNVLYYQIDEPTYSIAKNLSELCEHILSKKDALEIAAIKAGLDDLETSTEVDGKPCVTFKESDSAFDRVVVKDCGGCSSYLGMKGGEQRMCLGPNCIRRHGTIMHEFLHALGFHHEHQRADRDEYVSINFDNIRPGMEYNFRKLVEGQSVDHLGTPYDYGSVMHYKAYTFAEDPTTPTIIPKDPLALVVIGQRLALSDIDIERVQILYGCKNAADSTYFKHLA